MKSFQLVLFCALILFSKINAFSSHLGYGELTWICADSGKYIFTVKLYRDCNGIVYPPSVSLETNAPGFFSGINCNLVSALDISPEGPNCPSCADPRNQPNVKNEAIYQSGLINLQGVPPSTGWYFEYIDCCRNGAIVNLGSSGNSYFILRGIMYPYNGQNASPCFDSSPQFAERPTFASCLGSIVNYSNSAFDPDLDSLTYEWGRPLDLNSFSTVTNYPFATGYSFTSPLPSTTQNSSNIAATMDPVTGLISFKCFSPQGEFVTVTKVTSFKCGVKTAEIFREVPMAIVPCRIQGNVSNTPPDINGGLYIENYNIVAGDTLSLTIAATDVEPLPTTVGGGFQTVTLTQYGQHFGDGDTSITSGCLIPPCATMDPPTPTTNQYYASSNFNFVTTCEQVGLNNGCLQHQQLFSFTFRFTDNYCPINGVTSKIVNVYVTGPQIQVSGSDLSVSYPGATYQWYLNGAAVFGATDSIYTPIQSGIYTAIVTTSGGCEMISNAFTFSPTGLNSINKNDSFISIYPNPTEKGGKLNVLLNGVNSKENILQVMDINGRLIKQFNVQLNSESEHMVLDVSDISAGIYTLSLKNGNEITSKGFVIK